MPVLHKLHIAEDEVRPEERPTEEPQKPFRIVFTVGTVKPEKLPCFPYRCTQVSFDSLTLVAIIWANRAGEALNTLRLYWPSAQPREAEENVSGFLPLDYTVDSRQFGYVVRPVKTPWFRRFRR